MESNKILIGVQFIGTQFINPNDNNTNDGFSIELIVLRDSTLKQLLDGIKYGLMKKISDDRQTRTNKILYQRCKEIYDKCLFLTKYNDGKRYYDRISITSYDITKCDVGGSGRRVFFGEEDLECKLCDLGFVTSTRIVFDYDRAYGSYELTTSNIIDAFNPQNVYAEVRYPEYNISTRERYKFDKKPIKIIPPNDPPQKTTQSLIMMILPTLLMISVMVLVRGVLMSGNGSSNMSMILLTVSMGAVTLFTSLITFIQQKRNFKKDLKKWRESYEEYIFSLMAEIQKRKYADVEKLNELYPDILKIFDSANVISGDIFSRSQLDDDFLNIRLGLSNEVETLFEIKGDERDVIFSDARFKFGKDKYNRDTIKLILSEEDDTGIKGDTKSYLSNLPNAVAQKFKYLSNAPLLLPLKNAGSIGIVSNFDSGIIERMIFELCYYHSSDDLQFVVLFKSQKNWSGIEKCIKMYKFLPHFRGLFMNKSQFVFDSESASSVFSGMLNIMKEREAEKSSGENRFPHIVFIVYEEYGLKEHAFAEYLPKVPEDDKKGYEDKLGITFIFAKQYKEHLPSYCSNIINIDKFDNGQVIANIIPSNDINKKKNFTFMPCVKPDNNQYSEIYGGMYNSYKILSSICYSKISQNGKVPSNVELFGLHNIVDGSPIDVGSFWEINKINNRKFDVTRSIAVPLGRNDSGITYLDLHEKFDGPHMLVAGTTGSGKTETIISYLIGLCLQFRPDEVNLMLVDMKGGGFINRIGDLPHVVGTVTDVDGEESGTGDEYMLRRFLNALTAEVKERKLLLNKMGVDSVDKYIERCREINSKGDKYEFDEKLKGREDEVRKLAKERPLTHLILIVDEFTELKRFSAESDDVDFISEITTIARVGRSLGFHIILASQNIEGAITDDIRVNSKSRLCLKVATRQASKEMIQSDLAAAPTMPGNGRAYLLVGTGSKFEYFQSAYSGVKVFGSNADISPDIISSIKTPVEIIQAEKTGNYSTFYRSEKDNQEVKEKGKQQQAIQLDVICNAIKDYYNKNKSSMPEPHIVFQPPLPKYVIWDSDKGEPVLLSKKNGG